MSDFYVNMQWSPSFKAKLGMIQKGGELQAFIDSTALKQVEPYLPMREGALTKSGILNTEIGSGMIVHKTPYVRYLYYGMSKTGKPLKFDRSRHPKAGAFWWVRYMSDNLLMLEGMVQRRLNQLWQQNIR